MIIKRKIRQFVVFSVTIVAAVGLSMITNLGGHQRVYADVSSSNQQTACTQSGTSSVGADINSSPDAVNNNCTNDGQNSSTNTNNGLTSQSNQATNSSTANLNNNSNGLNTNQSQPPSNPVSPCNSNNTDTQSDGQTTNNLANNTNMVQPNNTNSANLEINSCDQQTAVSGQASVSTSGSNGSSTSGNADSTLNNVNQISTANNASSMPVNYTDNVYGNQSGNITINPEGSVDNSNQTNSGVNNNSLTSVNSQTSASINNSDNLLSKTGDSSVSNNGNGGTAISGNAEAIANIVNIINSFINDKQSFEGTINIYGNLYGDILLPQQLVNQLMSSQPNSSLQSYPGSGTNTDTASVNNNLNLIAQSGNAVVTNNGNGGTATSGNASTIANIENYVNNIFSTQNLFLVIINVAGTWTGYVLGNAPSGNLYLLSSNQLNNSSTQYIPTTTPVINNKQVINNNISLAAYSGNAVVINNGNGGTATSGNATVTANIFNFINDSFNVPGWFGILFINIFGSWFGSLSTYSNVVNLPSSSTSYSNIMTSFSSADNFSTNNSPDIDFSLIYLPIESNMIASPIVNSSTKSAITDYGVPQLVTNKARSQATSPNHHLNYWLALISLVPLLAIILFEKFVYNKKSNN